MSGDFVTVTCCPSSSTSPEIQNNARTKGENNLEIYYGNWLIDFGSCSLRRTQADSLLVAAMTSPSPMSISAYSPRPTPPISTPTSGACALAPKVMPQQRPIVPGDYGTQVGVGIVTQKEWVIPPRPKVRLFACLLSWVLSSGRC